MLHLLRFLGSRFQVDLIAPALDGAEDAQRLLKDVCAETMFVPQQGPGFLDRIGQVSPYVKDRALAAVVRERLASGQYGAVHLGGDLRPVPLAHDTLCDGRVGRGSNPLRTCPPGPTGAGGSQRRRLPDDPAQAGSCRYVASVAVHR